MAKTRKRLPQKKAQVRSARLTRVEFPVNSTNDRNVPEIRQLFFPRCRSGHAPSVGPSRDRPSRPVLHSHHFLSGPVLTFLGALLLALLAGGCGPDEPATASPPAVDSTDSRSHSLSSLIDHREELTKIAEALEAAGIKEKLGTEGPYTFFAPSNEAIARDIPEMDEFLSNNTDSLQALLEHHLIRGSQKVHKSGDSLVMSNFRGSALNLIKMPDEEIRVDGRRISYSQYGQNGVLYIVDSVLRPGPPVEPEHEDVREDAEMPSGSGDIGDLEVPDDAPDPDEPLPDLPPDN